MTTTTILDYPPGLHRDVPPDVYHARHLGLVSKSALDLVHHSLSRYKAWIDGSYEVEPMAALDFGSAFHCAVLEPDRFGLAYATEPDFGDCRKKENKAARDEWRETHAGRTLISPDDEKRIRGMSAALRAHPLAAKLLRDGIPEVTARWKDPETGLECKTRADYFVRRLEMAVDLKSADDASYEAFQRAIGRFRYDVTDALYRGGFGAIGAPVRHYVFLVVEKRPPYDVATYTLDSESIQRGYAHATADMQRLADAVRIDEWPGLPVGIQTINLPRWAA